MIKTAISKMSQEEQVIFVQTTKTIQSSETNALCDAAQIALITRRSNYFTVIENPSKIVQIAAVIRHPGLITYIKNPHDDVVVAALCSGQRFKHLDNKFKLIKIDQCPYSIGDIDHADEELQIIAVQSSPDAIGGIKNPTEKVEMIVMKERPYLISDITNPSEQTQRFVLREKESSQWYHRKRPRERTTGYLLGRIQNLSEKVLMEEVALNHDIVGYMNSAARRNDDTQRELIKINPMSVEYFPTMTVSTQQFALEANELLIVIFPKKFTSKRLRKKYAHLLLAKEMEIL